MTTAHTITSQTHWEALPIGALARVGFIEHDDDGNEVDEGKTMTVLRVEGDFRANAGDYMLAGGRYWSEVWHWEQGVTALDTATIPDPYYTDAPDPSHTNAIEAVDAAIEAHAQHVAEFNQTPYSEYVKLPPEAHPYPTPARDIVDALAARGWAPPPAYPEGVQVWTISGIPDGGRSDGTQAYLSLPSGDIDKQGRGDIWLDKPSVSVNFELPRPAI